MSSIALGRSDVIVGVDTHKHEHVAVVIDGLGGRLDELYVTANNDGHAELLAWASSFGRVHSFGVEGTGSYGIGLARFLRRQAVKVVEVSRPPRAGERRLDGKSDPIDAENAARQVLAGRVVATPKLADGIVEAIRLTRIARNGAVKAHTQAIVTLKATLVTADEGLRSVLEPLSDFKLMTACAALDTGGEPADPAVAMGHTLASIARRWLDLHDEIRVLTKRLDALTAQAAPSSSQCSGSVPTSPGSSSSPPATTPTESVPTPPSPSSAGSVRSPPAPVRPAAGTASTVAATARTTPPSTAASSSACGGTHLRSTTSPDAPPTV